MFLIFHPMEILRYASKGDVHDLLDLLFPVFVIISLEELKQLLLLSP
jgi:hypothetical protein